MVKLVGIGYFGFNGIPGIFGKFGFQWFEWIISTGGWDWTFGKKLKDNGVYLLRIGIGGSPRLLVNTFGGS